MVVILAAIVLFMLAGIVLFMRSGFVAAAFIGMPMSGADPRGSGWMVVSGSGKWTANRQALGYALAGALLSLYVLAGWRLGLSLGHTDLDQTWFAARALLARQDPYAAIAAHHPAPFAYRYFYPGAAPLVAVLLAPLDLWGARVAFALLSGGLFGWAIGRYRPGCWPLFLGLPFILVAQNLQWAGLLTAAMLLPGLGFLAAVKPNVGLVMLARVSSKRSGLLLLSGSLALLRKSGARRPEPVSRPSMAAQVAGRDDRRGSFSAARVSPRWVPVATGSLEMAGSRSPDAGRPGLHPADRLALRSPPRNDGGTKQISGCSSSALDARGVATRQLRAPGQELR